MPTGTTIPRSIHHQNKSPLGPLPRNKTIHQDSNTFFSRLNILALIFQTQSRGTHPTSQTSLTRGKKKPSTTSESRKSKKKLMSGGGGGGVLGEGGLRHFFFQTQHVLHNFPDTKYPSYIKNLYDKQKNKII